MKIIYILLMLSITGCHKIIPIQDVIDADKKCIDIGLATETTVIDGAVISVGCVPKNTIIIHQQNTNTRT
ncbi:MAG: hypothetical protein ACXU8A_00035 [Burkholderiaceae bacterium]